MYTHGSRQGIVLCRCYSDPENQIARSTFFSFYFWSVSQSFLSSSIFLDHPCRFLTHAHQRLEPLSLQVSQGLVNVPFWGFVSHHFHVSVKHHFQLSVGDEVSPIFG